MELTIQTYDQWVAEGKPLVQRWKGATLEVCRFLYPKREEFAKRGPLKSQLHVQDRTWTGFLGDIGLARMTAHDWLAKYDAKSDRLLPPPPESKPQPKKTPEKVAEQKRRIEEAQARFKDDPSEQEDSFSATEDVLLEGALNKMVEREQQRQTFKERIRLSQSGESDSFVDALMDYLEELESDSRRIEACQNIIKVCRNVAAELQR